jgi:hypothetical protein
MYIWLGICCEVCVELFIVLTIIVVVVFVVDDEQKLKDIRTWSCVSQGKGGGCQNI